MDAIRNALEGEPLTAGRDVVERKLFAGIEYGKVCVGVARHRCGGGLGSLVVESVVIGRGIRERIASGQRSCIGGYGNVPATEERGTVAHRAPNLDSAHLGVEGEPVREREHHGLTFDGANGELHNRIGLASHGAVTIVDGWIGARAGRCWRPILAGIRDGVVVVAVNTGASNELELVHEHRSSALGGRMYRNADGFDRGPGNACRGIERILRKRHPRPGVLGNRNLLLPLLLGEAVVERIGVLSKVVVDMLWRNEVATADELALELVAHQLERDFAAEYVVGEGAVRRVELDLQRMDVLHAANANPELNEIGVR